MNKRKLIVPILVCLIVALFMQQRYKEAKDYSAETYSESVVEESEQTENGESQAAKQHVRRKQKPLQVSEAPKEQEPEEPAKPEVPELSPEEGGYYYSQLTDMEKTIYAEIYHAIADHKEVEVSTLSVDLIDKINICVMNDHPEIFNVFGYTYTTHTRGDDLVAILFRAKYTYDDAEEARIKASIEAEVSGILGSAPLNGTDFDKIKYVYDSIVNNTAYKENAKDNQNIASVFLYHESVCQGYAKATQYLLNRLGVEAALVVGETDSGAHSWNLVKADDAWYYMDVTWGDADFQNEDADTAVQNVRPVSYDYFLVDSTTILATHSPTRTVSLPNCTAKENNYFVHENLYLGSLDTELIGSIFENGYASGADSVQFKCANRPVYDQVKNYLIEEQHIFDYVRTSGTVNYTVFEDTNTFCFWLFNS